MKKEFPYWNHNVAYYPWIKKKTDGCKKILDVGCGDGLLASYLLTSDKQITGIDPFPECIESASKKYKGISFVNTSFEEYETDEKFDAIIFTASIHHMNMSDAIKKSKKMLSDNGVLIIVGISKPSGILDFVIEGLRVIPSMAVSKINHITPCEEINVPVCYDIPDMKSIRKIIKEYLPNAKLGYGLHYRYLLEWKKERNT